MKFSPERLLGVGLLTGGALVGVVVIVLLSGYARSGGMTAVTATIGVIVGFLFLVLPQFLLGLYLIWRDTWRDTRRDTRRNARPTPPPDG